MSALLDAGIWLVIGVVALWLLVVIVMESLIWLLEDAPRPRRHRPTDPREAEARNALTPPERRAKTGRGAR